MSNCYTYNTLNYKNGIFDEVIDVTYILTMDDSTERHNHIRNELKKHQPTSKVIIVYNKGYKKCPKKYNCGDIDISFKDLTHSIMHIFDISKEKERILILEDDFIFNNNITSKDIEIVSDFLKKQNPNIYSLGSIHWASNPFTLTHKQLFLKVKTHAMIYSKKGRDYLQHKFEHCNNLNTIDIDAMTCFTPECYGYHKNIYAQLIMETENRSNWDKCHKYMPRFITKLILILTHIITVYIFRLDTEKKIHNKYDNLNKFMLLINILILIVLFYFFSPTMFVMKKFSQYLH